MSDVKWIVKVILPGVIYFEKRKITQATCVAILFYGSLVMLFLMNRRGIFFNTPHVRSALIVFGVTGILWHAVLVFTEILSAFGKSGSEELYEKGRLAYLKGNLDLALFYFKKLNLSYPLDEDGWYQHGKVLMEMNQMNEARKIWNMYLQKPFQKWRDEILLQLDGGL